MEKRTEGGVLKRSSGDFSGTFALLYRQLEIQIGIQWNLAQRQAKVVLCKCRDPEAAMP